MHKKSVPYISQFLPPFPMSHSFVVSNHIWILRSRENVTSVMVCCTPLTQYIKMRFDFLRFLFSLALINTSEQNATVNLHEQVGGQWTSVQTCYWGMGIRAWPVCTGLILTHSDLCTKEKKLGTCESQAQQTYPSSFPDNGSGLSSTVDMIYGEKPSRYKHVDKNVLR